MCVIISKVVQKYNHAVTNKTCGYSQVGYKDDSLDIYALAHLQCTISIPVMQVQGLNKRQLSIFLAHAQVLCHYPQANLCKNYLRVRKSQTRPPRWCWVLVNSAGTYLEDIAASTLIVNASWFLLTHSLRILAMCSLRLCDHS